MSKDKVALIIGAGDYLGSAIVKRFAKEGFHAVGTRRRGDIESFVKEIERRQKDRDISEVLIDEGKQIIYTNR